MAGDDRVWFITGCSSGFGREIAKLVLAKGDRAVLTARNVDRIADLVVGQEDRALLLQLDVTDKGSIAAAVARAEAHFGRIDILVNNAGYGYLAAIEEGEDAEIRREFETNVFGLIAMTQQVLPGMRRRRSGRIVNMSSMGGLMAFPGIGYYNGAKFAVEGLSEALAQEVAPLGIKVLIVEPGRFRTDFGARSLAETGTPIADYDQTAGERRRMIRANATVQPGDPARAAAAIVEVVGWDDPPLRLLLGPDAYELALARLDKLRGEFERVKAITVDTDFR